MLVSNEDEDEDAAPPYLARRRFAVAGLVSFDADKARDLDEESTQLDSSDGTPEYSSLNSSAAESPVQSDTEDEGISTSPMIVNGRFTLGDLPSPY